MRLDACPAIEQAVVAVERRREDADRTRPAPHVWGGAGRTEVLVAPAKGEQRQGPQEQPKRDQEPRGNNAAQYGVNANPYDGEGSTCGGGHVQAVRAMTTRITTSMPLPTT